MRSYYGDLIVDVFEFLLAFASILLVLFSSRDGNIIFFTISTIIYVFSRVLGIVYSLTYYSRDYWSLISNIVSLVSLVTLFCLIFVICFLYYSDDKQTINSWLISIFFIFSSISLSNILVKVFVGIFQKFNVIKENKKFLFNREG